MTIPFDSEAGHSGLLGKDVTPDLLDDRFSRRVGVELIGFVFIIHVIADANKFTAVIRASQQDDRNTKYVCVRNAARFGGIGFKDEFIHTDGDRADEERVELLIILVAGGGDRVR